LEELLMNLRPVCLLFLPGAPSAGQEQRAAVEPPPVEVTRPVVREVMDDAVFTGRTEAAQTVDVRPRVTGYLVKVAVKPGTTVKEGDLLSAEGKAGRGRQAAEGARTPGEALPRQVTATGRPPATGGPLFIRWLIGS
jgi:multidrug efflux pump subunit AcrA (membrane-fusion protein)